MKKYYSFLLIVIVFMLTACSNGLKGTYKLIEMKSSGQKFDADTIESLGMKMILTIKDSNEATLDISGQKIELTYNSNEFIEKNIKSGEEGKLPYKQENGVIIIQKGNEKLFFKK